MRRRAPAAQSAGSILLGGVLVGLCATQALDWVSIYFYEREDLATRIDEDEARGQLHAYERATDKLAKGVGVALDRPAIAKWGWRFHKAFGILGGVGYMALRRRYPKLGAGLGLLFGAAFFLGVDEVLVPALGLTPGPQKFSWKVHARGAISHLAYGVAAEVTARAFDAARLAS